MQKRTAKVAILAILACILVLSFSSVALADQTWSDLPDTVTAKYGITDNQVASISEGFGTLWKPYQNVTRAQFTKMAVAAFDIDMANPATASFTDVAKGSFYYQYIEGAKAAGVINGTTATTFSPNSPITRQQALAIIARYVAMANGYDLATMYTAADIDALLGHFGDAASVSADLEDEIAFAFDFGITQGNDFGNLAPLANLIRIQGAAMLIRAMALVPPANWNPAVIELVSDDKTENLIGQTHSVTFKVTDPDGHPAANVLVDFDTIVGPDTMVGNVEPEAAMTNNFGEVTVNLLSTEPGTQRVSATINGPNGIATVYTTKYWLVLDEVYLLSTSAQNNVGTPHEWAARVVVFGPGPRSTSLLDWYNAESLLPFDPTDINVDDGINEGDDWDYAFELGLSNDLTMPGPNDGWAPRTLAGIDVEWAIFDWPDNPQTVLTNEAVPSVGNITMVDGAAITPAKTAVGVTDDDGLSTITIESTVAGKTFVEAVADYAGNPYPEQLYNHANDVFGFVRFIDWDDQPAGGLTGVQVATKTWIAHTIPGGSTNISPADLSFNIGEEELLTLTLKDQYGNAVVGAQVEWSFQGVGLFKSDNGQSTVTVDIDQTDAAGTARVLIKSLDPGQQIVEAKYIDPKTGRATIDTANVQWYKVDVATFDNPATGRLPNDPGTIDVDESLNPRNEAVSTNEVGTKHTYDFWVYGLVQHFVLNIPGNTMGPTTQTPYIDTDAPSAALDGVLDAKDAAFLGGIFIVNTSQFGGGTYDALTGKIGGVYIFVNPATKAYLPSATTTSPAAGYTLRLGAGGITEFDFDPNHTGAGYLGKETAVEMGLMTGIYLPLEGKGVTFFMRTSSSTPALITPPAPWLPTPVSVVGSSISDKGDGGTITYGGATFTYDAVTDEDGHAWVEVTSNAKGPQWVDGIVDYPANPAKGDQREWGRALKTWTTQAAPTPHVVITMNGQTILPGEAEGPNPVFNAAGTLLNSAHLEVHVLDQFGNELPDYEAVYEIVGNGTWTDGSQGAADTYHPLQALVDANPVTQSTAAATLLVRYPNAAPFTNSAPGQTYEEFTNNGTATGTFSAQMTVASTWSWELAVQNLHALPVDPAKEVGNATYVTYTLWAKNGGTLTALANFTVNSSGALPTGKIFGTTAGGNVIAGTEIVVTAETAAPVVGSTKAQAATYPTVLANLATFASVDDGNGLLPDNSEPRALSVLLTNPTGQGPQTGVGPTRLTGLSDGSTDGSWDDPFGIVTGRGGYESFFFNSATGLPVGPAALGQATLTQNAAKAWTLNGIPPTRPHGSSIDIQLLENPFAAGVGARALNQYGQITHDPSGVVAGDDVRCIINLQIYDPADGPVINGDPHWTFEVQKIWSSATLALTQLSGPGDTTLGPEASVNPAGQNHTVQATVLNSDGQPVAGAVVDFAASPALTLVSGSTDPATTNSVGVATISYVAGTPGTYTITATTSVNGGGLTSNVLTKTWQTPVATAVTLVPATAFNLASDTTVGHQLTANVKDQFGANMTGVTVTFAATVNEGSVALSAGGTDATDASGNAIFTFTPTASGAWGNATFTAIAGIAAPASAVKDWAMNLTANTGTAGMVYPYTDLPGIWTPTLPGTLVNSQVTIQYETTIAGPWVDVTVTAGQPYVRASGTSFTTNVNWSPTWIALAHLTGSANNDSTPNYVYDTDGDN